MVTLKACLIQNPTIDIFSGCFKITPLSNEKVVRKRYLSKMKINLEEGLFIKIEGEIGKYQTLPIEKLVEIAHNLQELVFTIVKYDLPTDTVINLDNFKLELSGFGKSSAVPVFVLTPRIQQTISDYQKQRTQLSQKFDELLSLSDSGNYIELKEIYPDYIRRNAIVEKLYNFTCSFGDSPTSIGDGQNVNLVPVYHIKKFKRNVKNDIIVKVAKEESTTVENAFASLELRRTGGVLKKKYKEIIKQENHSLSYSPNIINLKHRRYNLNHPLRCLFEKEEDCYVISQELLDLTGTGESQEEAENNFNEEFDYLFQKLNSLSNSQITNRLLPIKEIMNHYVRDITELDGN